MSDEPFAEKPDPIPESRREFDGDGDEIEVIRRSPTSIISHRLTEINSQRQNPPAVPADALAEREKREKLDESIVGRIIYHRRRGRRYYNITATLNILVQLGAAVGAIATAGEYLDPLWLTLIIAGAGFAGSMLTTLKTEAKSRWYYDFYHGLSKIRNLLVYRDLPTSHVVDLLDTLSEEMTKTFPSFGNK